jgi:hypothetical protein
MNIYALEGKDHNDLTSPTQIAVIDIGANLDNLCQGFNS